MPQKLEDVLASIRELQCRVSELEMEVSSALKASRHQIEPIGAPPADMHPAVSSDFPLDSARSECKRPLILLKSHAAKIDAQENVTDGAEVPHSIFNYCVMTLGRSPKPWRDVAWLYLLLVCFVQQTMVMVLLQMNLDSLQDLYIRGNVDTPASYVEACRLEEGAYVRFDIFDGDLLIRTVIAFVGIIVVSITINSDVNKSYHMVSPDSDSSWLLRGLLTVFWYLQCVYLPSTAVMEIGRLFALSGTPMGILMNILAATFIVEIDEMFYDMLLAPAEKGAYEDAAAKLEPQGPSSGRNFLSWLRFSGMVWQYIYIRHTDYAHPNWLAMTNDVLITATAYLVTYFAEVFVQVYFGRESGGSTYILLLKAFASGFLSTTVGYFWWTGMASFGNYTHVWHVMEHPHLFECVSHHAGLHAGL